MSIARRHLRFIYICPGVKMEKVVEANVESGGISLIWYPIAMTLSSRSLQKCFSIAADRRIREIFYYIFYNCERSHSVAFYL